MLTPSLFPSRMFAIPLFIVQMSLLSTHWSIELKNSLAIGGSCRSQDNVVASRGHPDCLPVGSPPARKVHEGPVQCGLGSSRGGGPRRPNPWTKTLAIGTWNVTSLGGKEPELVQEVERYRLEIVGLTSTHSLGSGTQLLERGWTLHYSGVAQGERRQAGVGLLIAPQLSRHVLEFTPVNERVASLRLQGWG
ncbi:hypothetical protein L3Q82_015096 [Scortum barcoo]|uniref:Uncharacterized protein n=1 Tax=Scortum barcoo TaxID=214431 RepID=A0ACB8VT80_9TELE|nr:hypothetical protein L3Q82_015096 [Scortum barcoo]